MANQVLLISPYGEDLAGCFHPDDHIEWRGEPCLDLQTDTAQYDWIVSYGCRKIIRDPWLTIYRGRIVNLHISYLPFNKGSDPNFWSWFDGTPKGVTVHEINRGLDTGPIYDQIEINFKNPNIHTLATSYNNLRKAAPIFFDYVWSNIRKGGITPKPQTGPNGTYHKSADKERFMKILPLGWDTPVKDIILLGERERAGVIQ